MKLDYLECRKLHRLTANTGTVLQITKSYIKKVICTIVVQLLVFPYVDGFWIFFTYKITSSKKFLGLVTHFFKIIFGMDILIFDF